MKPTETHYRVEVFRSGVWELWVMVFRRGMAEQLADWITKHRGLHTKVLKVV